jgi:tRNA(fMet)-specific endonuclease VapC
LVHSILGEPAVDTDVFSYLRSNRAPYASLYRADVEGKLAAVSFITAGEMFFGAEKKSWGPERVSQLQEKLRKVTIVPFDFEVCRVLARIRNAGEKSGIPVAPNDLSIAACAIRHSIPVITKHEAHFQAIPGLRLRSRAAEAPEFVPRRNVEC